MKRRHAFRLAPLAAGLALLLAGGAVYASWQDYVASYLVNLTDPNTGKTATNVSESAGIVGNTDGTVWAATAGFALESYDTDVQKDDGSTEKTRVDEFANLRDAFDNGGLTKKAGGIRMRKEKYFVVSFDADRGVLYLKKSGGGACVAKSHLAYVVATFSSKLKAVDFSGQTVPQNPGLTNRACEDLQKFLTDNNL